MIGTQTSSGSGLCTGLQVVGYNFSEKYKAGGVVGVLGRDQVQLGAITVRRASLGLVTQASVDLSGASCAGVLVRYETSSVGSHLHGGAMIGK